MTPRAQIETAIDIQEVTEDPLNRWAFGAELVVRYTVDTKRSLGDEKAYITDGKSRWYFRHRDPDQLHEREMRRESDYKILTVQQHLQLW